LPNNLLIQFRGSVTEGVVKDIGSVHYFLQLFVEFTDGKRFVGTVIFDGAFNARTVAIPDFLFQIARSDKHRELLISPWRDHCDCFRFFKTGQIKEVRILAIAIMSIVRAYGLARGWNDGYGILVHAAHELDKLGFKHRLSSN
jgi:hypothetical protein